MNGAPWDGLGNFALATGIYATPGGSAGAGLVVRRGDAIHIMVLGAKSMVGYERGEDDPATATARTAFKTLSAIVTTTDPGGASNASVAGAKGANARRPLPDTRELIRRFRRRFVGADAHITDIPQTRTRNHQVDSRRSTQAADTRAPTPGTVGATLANR